MPSKLELPGSVSTLNVAGGGMRRFLRRRFTSRDIFQLAGNLNTSIRVYSSLPLMLTNLEIRLCENCSRSRVPSNCTVSTLVPVAAQSITLSTPIISHFCLDDCIYILYAQPHIRWADSRSHHRLVFSRRRNALRIVSATRARKNEEREYHQEKMGRSPKWQD